MGRTGGPALARPMLDLDGRPDGAVSADGRIMGCYVHGLFAADGFRHAFLARLRARAPSGLAFEQQIDATLDALADHLEAHADLDGLLALARREAPERQIANSAGKSSRAPAAAREHEQRERAADVGWGRGGAAVAHPGVVDHLAAVAARPGEARGRARRRSPPRASRHWASDGAAHRATAPPAVCRRGAGQAQRRRQDQERRQARRQPVGQVVEARREAAEMQVPRRAVADHAVEVLIALYAAMPGRPSRSAPEQRRHDAVGEVLRGRFDRGPGDAVRVQARRIAPDDVRDRARGPAARPCSRPAATAATCSCRPRAASSVLIARPSGSQP